ncbi:MAG: tetratricopeptide repeat protein [Pyrinomonadaceae bacterium]
MPKYSSLVEISNNVFRLERVGKYPEALALLDSLCVGDVSCFDGLECDVFLRAEFYLRKGAIIGFLGRESNMISRQQESRDLLMRARDSFIALNNVEKIVECENYLSTTYTRTGELDEALIWINEALRKPLKNDSLVRIHSYVVNALFFWISKRYSEGLEFHRSVQGKVIEYGDWYLKGSFAGNYGLLLSSNGRYLESIDWLLRARRYHTHSNHSAFLASVENNLALVYSKCSNYEKAKQCADRSIEMFNINHDLSRKGAAIDTKSGILFREGNYEEALKLAESAVSCLSKTESDFFMVDATLSKAKAHLMLGEFGLAKVTINRSIEIARTISGENSGEFVKEEYRKVLDLKKRIENARGESPRLLVSGKFELVVPPELSIYPGYEVVRIRNSHLSSIGVPENALAVVAESTIKRGDLIVATEIETDSIVCGFYDYFAGIVSISGIDSETLLYRSEEVKVTGKIIGVAKKDLQEDKNRLYVTPLDI